MRTELNSTTLWSLYIFIYKSLGIVPLFRIRDRKCEVSFLEFICLANCQDMHAEDYSRYVTNNQTNTDKASTNPPKVHSCKYVGTRTSFIAITKVLPLRV